jgi:hypothetical protein
MHFNNSLSAVDGGTKPQENLFISYQVMHLIKPLQPVGCCG